MEIDEDYYNYFADKSLYEKEPVKQCVTDAELPSMANGCFDCNICLDFATDPVVTLCGHLYCWPCIHKWLRIKSTSPCRCPVCKAVLSIDSLVPLYGRGFTKKGPKQSLDDVPQRPQLISHRQPSRRGVQSQRHYHYENFLDYYDGNMNDGGYMSPYWPTETRVFRSTAGGVLEGIAVAVLPWMFRNHERVYNPRSHLATTSTYNSRRQMRQEMQAQKWLSQIWSFLFFCSILCLLLF